MSAESRCGARACAARALLLSACPQRPDAPAAKPAPPATISAQNSAWSLSKESDAPVFKAGQTHVFIRAQSRAHSRYLPGVSIGSKRGPELGFLGGFYAPMLMPTDTGRAYKLDILAKGDRLRVRFGEGGPEITVFAPAPGAKQVKLHVLGDITLTAAVDGTNIRGVYQKRPSFARRVLPGEKPGLEAKLAERIEVKPKKGGAWLIDTNCTRPRILRPLKRGSTSQVLLQLGKGPARAEEFDSLYRLKHTPSPHPELAQCPKVSSSTLTFTLP